MIRLVAVVLTEIRAFKNVKKLQRNVWKCEQIRTFVRICPHTEIRCALSDYGDQ